MVIASRCSIAATVATAQTPTLDPGKHHKRGLNVHQRSTIDLSIDVYGYGDRVEVYLPDGKGIMAEEYDSLEEFAEDALEWNGWQVTDAGSVIKGD
jgi:hypothetical protein